ncbi:MAG: hypothetical protein KF892_08550 [Rhizobacter sp.]|nr:hypothetical protein [Rhizobacter sp.]
MESNSSTEGTTVSGQNWLFSCPLFSTGYVIVTHRARAFLHREGVDPTDLLVRHTHGDWFDLCFEEQARNIRAVARGGRVFTSFSFGTRPNIEKVFVITEYDRSSSTIVLGAEYLWAALN